jgi:uncharacterized membrane protein (DUF485 family)
MIAALIPLGWALAYLYAFWLLYVLVMGFYRAWLAKRLTRVALVLASPALVLGYVANWTLAALLFWQWPQRPLELVTDRLTRYISTPSGWREAPALWVCQSLLDYFDPHERHCSN